jgi:hypothetical protein
MVRETAGLMLVAALSLVGAGCTGARSGTEVAATATTVSGDTHTGLTFCPTNRSIGLASRPVPPPDRQVLDVDAKKDVIDKFVADHSDVAGDPILFHGIGWAVGVTLDVQKYQALLDKLMNPVPVEVTQADFTLVQQRAAMAQVAIYFSGSKKPSQFYYARTNYFLNRIELEVADTSQGTLRALELALPNPHPAICVDPVPGVQPVAVGTAPTSVAT